ncbi:LamG-like jellyroll fold domain-containing protein [Nocardioides xinjiangensis]|uniref:LamG-like jellyroll fold domain-containing protein n=1 Tax=Nocardioides xinjiangensis TaxID=2817376 RepID=UPI001B30CAAA|nr:LamG-like jellyroll fold domain-containing protein [Nocardioides sp. SYSU D00778]
MPSQRTAAAAAGWARLTAVLVSRAYRTGLLTLSVIALAPLLFGWGSFVIKSGSMGPSIDVGDVVVARPFAIGEKVAVGRVYVFDDPSTSREHLLTHRIVELRDDGSYTSAGDANEVTDATPVTTDDFEARGILLVPFVGLPVTWLQNGQWVRLGLWLLLTVAAFWAATRNLDGEPPKWNLLRFTSRPMRQRRSEHTSDDADDDNGAQEVPAARRVPHRVARRHAPALLGIVIALSGTGLGTANAGFTAQTRSPGMRWTVASFVQPYVAAVLADNPATFWLLDEAVGTGTAQDRSGNQTLGTYRAGATLGQTGALTSRNPGTSMRAAGGLAVTSARPVAAPTAHSIELWFRTTSTTGGYLVGFESTTATTSPLADRIARMTPSGQLTYGNWSTNPVRTITTPRAYNDGNWHQLVVAVANPSSFGDTVLYVDGVAAVSGQTSKAEAYNGYWRVGAGAGTSPAFNGTIDNLSIYLTTMPAARVAAHYAAR